MLSKKKLENNKGFTIIEVMIVLAIAGLIMLIVFLAVPALQRNARNTQRKDDIGKIGSAVTTIVANKNGSVAAVDNPAVIAEVGTFSYYTTSTTNPNVVSGATANPGLTDTATVVKGAKCSGASAVAGSARQVAILYTVEPATNVCIDV